MAIPSEPLTRMEQYLNRTATGGGTIPDEPLTRAEMYLNKIATGSGEVPEEELTRVEQYLAYIAESGGGGGDTSVDFDAGNIAAIVSHGTEYILTDFYGHENELFSLKIADSSVNAYEGYISLQNGTKSHGFQRSGSQKNIYSINFRGTAITVTDADYGDGKPAIMRMCGWGLGNRTPEAPLVIFGNYYNNALESTKGTFTFYGLNIVNLDGTYAARFMPWLENGVACVKDIVSETIFTNAGTGAFDWIDKDGVTHSA